MSGRRVERLEQEVREQIARMINAELKDPRIGFVTVTRVSLTPDLHQARVYVGILGDAAARERGLAGLKQAAGFLRRALGQRLRLRHAPEVQFQYDRGLDAADRVARLLDEVHAEEAAEREPKPGDDEA